MRLIFVRHGEPNYEKDCLTELGTRQAHAAAIRLKKEKIDAICSSPMGRAMQTAQITADACGFHSVSILSFMHELYWGTLDGSPMFAGGNPWNIADKLVEDGWDLARSDWKEHPLFRCNRVVKESEHVGDAFDQWLETWGYKHVGAGYLCMREDHAQHSVAVFSHGGSSAAAMARLMNLPFPYICAFLHQPFTGITIFRLNNQPGEISFPVLELGCDGQHLAAMEDQENSSLR